MSAISVQHLMQFILQPIDNQKVWKEIGIFQ